MVVSMETSYIIAYLMQRKAQNYRVRSKWCAQLRRCLSLPPFPRHIRRPPEDPQQHPATETLARWGVTANSCVTCTAAWAALGLRLGVRIPHTSAAVMWIKNAALRPLHPVNLLDCCTSTACRMFPYATSKKKLANLQDRAYQLGDATRTLLSARYGTNTCQHRGGTLA